MSLTSALARSNPSYAGTRKDWETLAQANPGKAAGIAHKNSSRLANALVTAENATVMALELLIIGGTNVGLSMWDGNNDYKRNMMVDSWRNPQNYDQSTNPVAKKSAETLAAANLGVVVQGTPLTEEQTAKVTATSPFKEGGFKDPTNLWGLPVLLWTTAASGLVAFLARKSEYAYLALSLAVGSLTAWTGSLGHEIGLRMAAKRATAATTKK